MSTIKTGTTLTTAYQVEGDTTGALVIQTGSTPTTAVTVGSDQNVTVAGNVTLNNGTADGAQLTLSSSGYSDWNWDNYSGRLRAYYGATEYFTINSSGNVGIGTSSPNAKTEVNSSTAGGEVSRFEGAYSSSGTVALSNWRRNGGAVAAVMRYNDANTDMEFGTTTSHAQAFITGGSERMRIDSSGNVGIGTSSPSSRLTVSDATNTLLADINSSSANGAYMVWRTSGTVIADLGTAQNCFGTGGADTFAINGRGARALLFGTNNTERARIDSSGALLVNFTANPYSSDVSKLAVQGTETPLWVQGTGSGYCQGSIAIASGSSDGPSGRGLGTYMFNRGTSATWYTGTVYGDADQFYITRKATASFDSSTAQSTYMKMRLTSSGVAYQGNNSSSWSTTSDIRLKDNIRGVSNALEKITSLNPCHFEYKFALGKTKTGFIAQEFEQVFPGHVYTDKATPDLEEYVGKDGDVKSIDADLIPYLVKAIQEQQTIIQAQAADIAALKEKVGL